MAQYLFGVTGGMASGKSYTCQKLSQVAAHKGYDFGHIDVDHIRRFILLGSRNPRHVKLRKKLIETLKIPIFQEPYFIPGDILGQIIFFDRDKMAHYKNIVNPEIIKQIQQEIPLHDMVAVEWSMLIEDGWLPLVKNNLLLIGCSRQQQLNRLKDSDLPLDQLEARIAYQPQYSTRKEAALNSIKKAGVGSLLEYSNHSNAVDQDYHDLFLKILNNFSLENENFTY